MSVPRSKRRDGLVERGERARACRGTGDTPIAPEVAKKHRAARVWSRDGAVSTARAGMARMHVQRASMRTGFVDRVAHGICLSKAQTYRLEGETLQCVGNRGTWKKMLTLRRIGRCMISHLVLLQDGWCWVG
jgi:hypothetical protein